jgi:transposase-like protein
MARETKDNVVKLVQQDKDLLKALVPETVQQVLETEMAEALGAGKSQRTAAHRGYRSAVSRLNVKLDDTVRRFAERPLDEEYPYVIFDARYERVREDGIVGKRAVLIAIGVNHDVRLANRESRTSWKDFLSS